MSSQHQFRSLPLRARKFQNRFCFQCGTRSTSQWRYSEDGSMLLCNACGIRSKKKPTISKRRSGRRHPKKFRERPTPPPSSNSEYMYQLMPCSPSQLWKECCRQGPNPFIPFDNPALSPNRCLDKGLIGNPILSLPTNIPSRLSSPFENKNTRIPQEAIIDSKGSTISGCYQTYDGKNTPFPSLFSAPRTSSSEALKTAPSILGSRCCLLPPKTSYQDPLVRPLCIPNDRRSLFLASSTKGGVLAVSSDLTFLISE